MLPTFLVCGVHKSGTTTLYELLESHPEIGMSKPKEVCFFNADESYSRGLAYYERHFEHVEGKRAVGEASPLYYNHSDAPRRVAESIPNAKLLFVCRNPVDRCYSNFMYDVAKGKESRRFVDVIRSQRGQKYIERGLYYRHIRRWYDYFPENGIKIILFEELKANPTAIMQGVFAFLGVSDHCAHLGLTHANPTAVPKNRLATGLLAIAWLFHQYVPSAMKKLWRVSVRPRITSPGYPPMDPATRDWLAEIYCEDIYEFEKLLGRSLQCWN